MLKIAFPYHLLTWQKKVSTSIFFKVFCGYFRFRLIPVYKTQNIITTEPNKQVRSGFLYLMPYSLIKKISVLQVHFPHKTYFKSCNARRATQKNWWFFMIRRACHPKRVNSEIFKYCWSSISHDEFVSVKNVLREYNEIKEEIKNPKTSVEYII